MAPTVAPPAAPERQPRPRGIAASTRREANVEVFLKAAVLIVTLLVLFAAPALAQPFAASPLLGPATHDNYESCDITFSPAATLLLPYFEVDPAGTGENTLVTLTNASTTAIVAHVTVWTDWSYPVVDFNLLLTGYDVEGFSLRDVLVRGDLPSTSFGGSPIGRFSGIDVDEDGKADTHYVAPYIRLGGCSSNEGGPGAIPASLLAQVQSALTGGPFAAGDVPCEQVGSLTENLIGYITIDTVSDCTQSLPIDAPYFQAPEIRWENQLLGDSIRLNDARGVAGANPLVHIKAVPGGGASAVTTLPHTFYERFQQSSPLGDSIDRRQPLPALFAARYIEAGTAFDTDFVIWREGYTDEVETADCNGDLGGLSPFDNSRLSLHGRVRFDERENPTLAGGGCPVLCPPEPSTTATRLENIGDRSGTDIVPQDPSSDSGGWIYMNLAHPTYDVNGTHVAYGRASYNWVQVRMTGVGVYGVDFDASYLGNGCTPIVTETGNTSMSSNKIGPKYDRGGQLWSGN